MKVRLITDAYEHDGIPMGTEFDVVQEDSGEFSLVSFFQGWVKPTGRPKCLMDFDKEECEVINFE